jgi:hypothetical protein
MNIIAGHLGRWATAELAQSALPTAPIRPDRPRRRTRPRFWRR